MTKAEWEAFLVGARKRAEEDPAASRKEALTAIAALERQLRETAERLVVALETALRLRVVSPRQVVRAWLLASGMTLAGGALKDEIAKGTLRFYRLRKRLREFIGPELRALIENSFAKTDKEVDAKLN
jgi:hypothetical protein